MRSSLLKILIGLGGVLLLSLGVAACGGGESEAEKGGTAQILLTAGGVDSLDPGYWYYKEDYAELLPNLVAPIIVYATLVIPQNILFEAALSFLGVGIQPPNASWGQMIADATSIFDTAWWYMVFPGAALLLTVLAFNLVGDGLQDALNPKGNR